MTLIEGDVILSSILRHLMVISFEWTRPGRDKEKLFNLRLVPLGSTGSKRRKGTESESKICADVLSLVCKTVSICKTVSQVTTLTYSYRNKIVRLTKVTG